MKTNNMFDKMDRETEINQDTVNKETGASTENIKAGFYKRIESQKNSKKREKVRAGKVVAILAAAVAATLTVSIVAVAAQPTINEAFAGYFAGECDEGVYSGSNIKTSSDKVNVEFLGVAGDDSSALTLVKLTKKDGEDFVNGYDNNTYFVYNFRTENQDGFYAGREKYASEWISGADVNNFVTVDEEFSFSDNKTIVLRMQYMTGNGSPKGVTLVNSCNTVTVVNPVSTVYTFTEKDADKKINIANKNVTEDISEEFMSELNSKYGSQLKEGQQFCLSKDGREVVIADVKDIELDYALSARLDYKSSDMVSLRNTDGEKCNIAGADWDIQKIDAQSFSMELSARSWDVSALNIEAASDNNNDLYDVFDNLDITLADGKHIKATKSNLGETGGTGTDGTWCEVNLKYFFYNENGIVIIDPSEIKEIKCSGVVIGEQK